MCLFQGLDQRCVWGIEPKRDETRGAIYALPLFSSPGKRGNASELAGFYILSGAPGLTPQRFMIQYSTCSRKQ